MLNATALTAAPVTLVMDAADRALYGEAFLQRWDGNTRLSYRDDLKIFFNWCDNNMLDVFTAHRAHLEMFMRYLKDVRGNGPSTIRHRMGTLRTFYEIALDDDLVRKNPCRLLRLPKVHIDQDRKIALSDRDFERLVWAAAASKPTDYALILLMGVCGLRVSEACSLNVEGVTGIQDAHRMLRFVEKGGGFANVPQPPLVIQAVDRCVGARTSGALLLRRDGSRMTRRSADRVVKRLANAAHIQQRLSNHGLRHTAAMSAARAKVPMEIVARSLRHKDVSTTYKFYDRGVQLTNSHSAYAVAGQIQAPPLAVIPMPR